jgi:hypothetical protein
MKIRNFQNFYIRIGIFSLKMRNILENTVRVLESCFSLEKKQTHFFYRSIAEPKLGAPGINETSQSFFTVQNFFKPF